MSIKLFNKSVPASCSWCIYGKKSAYTEDILCSKKGVKNKIDSCRAYKYDPLKRTPKKQINDAEYSAEDFKL